MKFLYSLDFSLPLSSPSPVTVSHFYIKISHSNYFPHSNLVWLLSPNWTLTGIAEVSSRESGKNCWSNAHYLFLFPPIFLLLLLSCLLLQQHINLFKFLHSEKWNKRESYLALSLPLVTALVTFTIKFLKKMYSKHTVVEWTIVPNY